MAVVTGFAWSLECDIHVLSGMTTLPLRDLLTVTIDNELSLPIGALAPSLQTAVGLGSVSLEPEFKRTRPDTMTAQGKTLVHGNGIDFELETGRVIALPVATGQRRMRNFLVWAELQIVEYIKDTEEMPVGDDRSALGVPVVVEVTVGGGNSGSNSSSTGPATPIARTALAVIRIHIHDRIRKWWPTPEKMRVVAHSAGASPRLLADFDDGVAADITEWPSVIEGLGLTWTSANPARVQVDATSGRLRSTGTPSPSPVNIQARLNHPALPAGFAPSAPVRAHVAAAWPLPRPVSFIAGPGPQHFESATNILFLADGFIAGEEARFRELVARLADPIVSREDMQPFKLLRESINFWGLFLASEESGTTLLSEHLAPLGNAPFKLDEVPDTDLEDTAGALTLERLIRFLGLPVLVDFGVGESDSAAFTRLVPLLANDFVLPLQFNNIDLAMFAAWRRLAGRSLVESRDTLFAVQAGGRPFVGRRPPHSPSLDSRRIEDGDIAALVGALYCDVKDGGAPQRLPVGRVWERPSPVRRGKDAGLVCVLSRASSFGAVTVTDTVFGPKHVLAKLWRYNGTEDEMAARQTGRATFVLRPSMVNPAHGASPNMVLPIMHELGHVFGLVDEYGGKRPTDQVDPPKAFPNGQWRYELFRRSGDPLGPYDAPTTLPTDQRISPSKIVWAAWARLRAAGELVARPEIVGTTVHVQLRKKHARDFALDMQVKIRQRPLLGPTGTRSSPAMRIIDIDITRDEVQLECHPNFTPADTYDFDVLPSRLAPVLMLPLRRPGSEPLARREQPLVAPEILAHIGESGGPLNAAANNPMRPCTAASSPVAPQFPSNLPATLTRTPEMERATFRRHNIVGLYQGGLGVDCGAYHPAGDCMMRGAIEESRTQSILSADTAEYRPFCHVCRYWLVDRIDPSKHRALDDLYDPSYPGPRPYE